MSNVNEPSRPPDPSVSDTGEAGVATDRGRVSLWKLARSLARRSRILSAIGRPRKLDESTLLRRRLIAQLGPETTDRTSPGPTDPERIPWTFYWLFLGTLGAGSGVLAARVSMMDPAPTRPLPSLFLLLYVWMVAVIPESIFKERRGSWYGSRFLPWRFPPQKKAIHTVDDATLFATALGMLSIGVISCAIIVLSHAAVGDVTRETTFLTHPLTLFALSGLAGFVCMPTVFMLTCRIVNSSITKRERLWYLPLNYARYQRNTPLHPLDAFKHLLHSVSIYLVALLVVALHFYFSRGQSLE
jgi:hypothetical protein